MNEIDFGDAVVLFERVLEDVEISPDASPEEIREAIIRRFGPDTAELNGQLTMVEVVDLNEEVK